MWVDTAAWKSRLTADLRTVLVLLTGRRVPAARCRMLIEEVCAGADAPVHEAVVYLLATHLLALDEARLLDEVAWRWLSRRDGTRAWSPTSAADALRMAVFAVESGWPRSTLTRLLGLLAIARTGDPWVDLDDVARRGGRHASRLESLVHRSDPSEPFQPARRAAMWMLTRCGELPAHRACDGPGWALVSSVQSGQPVGLLFSWGRDIPDVAERAVADRWQREGWVLGQHAFGPHVRSLRTPGAPRRVVPLRAVETIEVDLGLSQTARTGPAANAPAGLTLDLDRVTRVFASGSLVVSEARWWVAGGGARRAR